MSSEFPIGEKLIIKSAKRPERKLIRGELISLMPLNVEKHGDSLFQQTQGKNAEEKWVYLWEGPFPVREEFDAYLENCEKSEDPLYYAIVCNQTGMAMGHAAYLRMEPAHQVIEVGSILYGDNFKQTKGATEAMYLMAKYAFEELGYRRYEWKCNVFNAPSRKAAERLGFTFEGIFRQHLIIKGRNRDTAWYSMLDKEWPKNKAALESWLHPSNFDVDGQQRQRLANFRFINKKN